MRSGLPPAADPRPESVPAGPSEVLSLGETGLIGLPSDEVRAALTFVVTPTGGAGDDADARRGAWEYWCREVFAPVLAPALVEIAACAAHDRARELRDADLALAGRLSAGTLPRAREEGRRLLAHLQGVRSARWLSRFVTWAAAGETPALFPTVFAARAGLFHLPPRPLLFGYALLEWRAATRHVVTTVTPHHRPEQPSAAVALDAVRGIVADVLRPALAAA